MTEVKAVDGRLVFLREGVEVMVITPQTVVVMGELRMETRSTVIDGSSLETVIGYKMPDWEWLAHGLAQWQGVPRTPKPKGRPQGPNPADFFGPYHNNIM